MALGETPDVWHLAASNLLNWLRHRPCCRDSRRSARPARHRLDSPFLNRLGDLSHPLVAVRAAEEPDGQPDAVGDGDPRADERKQHRMVVEEAPDDQRSYPLTKSAPSDLGAGRFLSHSA